MDMKLQPSIITYTAAIKCFSTDHPTLLALLKHMDQQAVQLDTVMYSASIWALGNDWSTALAMLERMFCRNVEVNAITCNSMIGSCDQAGQWQRALDVFGLQKVQRIQLDAFTYSSVASACAKSGHWTLASWLLVDMTQRQIESNTICMNAMMNCFEKGQQWSRVLTCLEEMTLQKVRPDRTSYNIIISACDWPTSLLFLQDMINRNLQRDVVSFNAAMQSCTRGTEWSSALWILKEMPRLSVRRSIVSMNTAMSACEAADQIDLSGCMNAIISCYEQRIPRRSRQLPFEDFVARLPSGSLNLWCSAVALHDSMKGSRLRRAPLTSRNFLAHLALRDDRRGGVDLRRQLRSGGRGARSAVRINGRKVKTDLLKKLKEQGWHLTAAPFHPDAFMLDFVGSAPTLGLTPAHLTGEVYLQELSSMLPAAVLHAVLPQKVSMILDLCAAPGSKSTQLAQDFSFATVVANEPDVFRAGKLRANLFRLGLTNYLVTLLDGRAVGDLLPEQFDGVLVDAPCSCEGNMRKDVFASLRAGLRDKELEEKQLQLLLSGWKALKSGGYLVYSTCTLNHWENEGVCEQLLLRSDCERIELQPLRFPVDLSGRLWPHQLDVEGFFVACFRKREAAIPYHDGQSWAPAKLLSTSEVMELKHLALEMWDFWPFDEDHEMGQFMSI
eukprot:symbB.v1.2.023196.t1/scaffold2107.1/size91221/5